MINKIYKHISNLPGWRTKRRIVVFESDDWGSIRMPSHKVFKTLKAKCVDVTTGDSLRYNLYDNLATADDLSALFETLLTVKDKNGNHAVFTAISLVANPDFEKIEANGFHEYFYEPFNETLKRFNGCEKSFELWKEGVKNCLFVPEFHGREHLNVQVWMRALQNNDPNTLLAFKQKMWGFNNKHPNNISYQAAFDLEFPEDVKYQKSVIAEGLNLFKQLHGYKASFFVPPNGPFNSQLEEPTYYNGIRYISTSKIHREPQGNGQLRKKYFWLGKQNRFGQRFITRNAFFEPSIEEKNWVDSCLRDISVAFNWNKPATISTHRVNYIGALNPINRDNGLRQLKELLIKIVKTWPRVEFLTSNQLGKIIEHS